MEPGKGDPSGFDSAIAAIFGGYRPGTQESPITHFAGPTTPSIHRAFSANRTRRSLKSIGSGLQFITRQVGHGRIRESAPKDSKVYEGLGRDDTL